MRFINNLPIKSKLLLSFTLIIFLSGLGMFISLKSLDNLNTRFNFIVDNDITLVINNLKIRRATIQMRFFEKDIMHAVSNIEKDHKLFQLRQAQEEAISRFENISKLNLDAATFKVLESYKNEFLQFNNYLNKDLNTLESIKTKEEIQLNQQETDNAFDKVLDTATYITNSQEKKFQRTKDETDLIYTDQVKNSFIIIFVIFLFAFLLAWSITKSTGGRILKLIKTTDAISKGNLDTQKSIDGTDEISQLADAIDLMQSKLRTSNDNIEQQNWIKTGVAQINAVSLGQEDVKTLTTIIITEIAEYIGAGIGALYLVKDLESETSLKLFSSYAYPNQNETTTEFKLGEGLIGQAALSRKPILLNNASNHYTKIVSGINASTPNALLILPILYEETLQGVLEIGAFRELSPIHMEYLTQVTEVIAKAIEITSAQDKMKHQQIALTEANEKLTVLDQMKTNFLSTVSHELRTPLTSVIGFARIMQKKFDGVLYPALADNEDKKVVKAIRQVMDNTAIIVEEGERLTSLINNVLDLAKMEAGRIDWNITDLNIEEILDRSIASTSSLFSTKPVTLVKKVPEILPLCSGDHDRLIQVVINLISNAIKFTDQGLVTLKAELGLDELIISVIDNGTGIKPEDQPLVFEKFKQVGDTMTDKPQGTGLGLPICKEIIEHLGGRIWVESAIGKGSVFSFSVPVSKNQPKINPINRQGEHKFKNILITNEGEEVSYIWQTESAGLEKALEASIEQSAKTKEKSLPNILVIDDNLNIRQFLHQELSAANFEVREASSGTEGLAMINEQIPDLIILDVKMPHLNGFEVAVRLHTNPLTLHIPVILHTITEDQALGEQLGIDCYLNKPVKDEVLLNAVNHLLKARQARKKILLFIKNSEKRQRWTALLSKCNFEVVATENISEAIASAVEFDPQLVIAETAFAKNHKIIEQLRFDLGLDKVLFTLLDE